MKKKPKYKIAVLIHSLEWKSAKSSLSLGNGLYFHQVIKHPVRKLYEAECRDNNLDDGDPYLYETCLTIHDWEGGIYTGGFPRDPYSQISQLINVLATYYHRAVDMVRIFISSDNFKTFISTEEVDFAGAQCEFLLVDAFELRDGDFMTIKKIWANVCFFWMAKQSQSRVINAFTHLYYSWNMHYLEQTAIHISIVLEILFSPHSKDELSHQIAFNACQFLAATKAQKQEIYKKVKKYYNIRSKIIHGDWSDRKDELIIPEFFRMTCTLLIKIISNKRLASMFEDNAKRRQYFDDLIFG